MRQAENADAARRRAVELRERLGREIAPALPNSTTPVITQEQKDDRVRAEKIAVIDTKLKAMKEWRMIAAFIIAAAWTAKNRKIWAEALAATAVNTPKPRQTARGIVLLVSAYFNLPAEELFGSRRSRSISYARQIAMYIVRMRLGRSLPRIGKLLSGRDHTTILSGVRKIQREIAAGKDAARHVEAITAILDGQVRP